MHVIAFLTLALPLSLSAAACPPGTLCNPLQAGSLYEFLQSILQAVIFIGFPIIVLYIVWIGFRFVQTSASGNSEELKKVKNNLWFAIIGALLLLGAQALTFAIQGTVEGLQRGL